MGRVSSEEKPKENQEKTKRKPKENQKEYALPAPPPEGRGTKKGRLPKTAQRIDKWSTLLRECRKEWPAPSCAIRSGGVYAASAENPFGEAWRAEALQIQSEPGDMRGGFGSLAQQGSAYHTSAGMQEGAASPFLSHPQRRTVEKPHWEAWRAEALQIQSEPGDMCGGFGSLAQQGFPARFPGRAPRRRGNVSWRKMPAKPAFFDKRKTVDKALSTA